jgi:uncharacterized membrane protein
MRVRLIHLLDLLTAGYWFLPLLMSVGAVLLAVLCLAIDAAIPDAALANNPFLYVADADAERSTLLSVGTVTLGTAGVVFSLTTVPLTVAASQFGSRLLRNFLRDRITQVVLSMYFATFIYCMVVLFSIPNRPEIAELPHIATTVSLLMALTSFCLLVYFIHHIGVSLQAPTVIAEVGDELRRAIEYHAKIGEATGAAGDEPKSSEAFAEIAAQVEQEGTVLNANKTGYVHAIAIDELTTLAAERDIILRLLRQAGDFLTEDSPLAVFWPSSSEPSPEEVTEVQDAVNNAYLVGYQRIPTLDVEFAVNQLVEIAVRALSPAINDPFTAMTCLDRLGIELARFAAVCHATPYRFDNVGRLRVILEAADFSRLTDAAFHQIRQYGRGNAEVLSRLLDALLLASSGSGLSEERAALLRHARLVEEETNTDGLPNPYDRERVRKHAEAVLARLDNRGAKRLTRRT